MKQAIYCSVSVLALVGTAVTAHGAAAQTMATQTETVAVQASQPPSVQSDTGSLPNNTGPTSDTAITQPEDIVVTGFRKSLADARDLKLDAPSIRDVLAAEDIGALPSLSIADSLERIPGLAADRDRGSPSQISIRGLGPLFGFTLFNGRELTTAAPDRNIRFNQFPASLIASADILKAPQADLIEGGISGTVNLKSVRPLDVKQNQVVAGQLLADYSDLDATRRGSNGLHPRGNLNYIGKFFGDRLGIALGLSIEKAAEIDAREINGAFANNIDFNGDTIRDFAPANIQYRYTTGSSDKYGYYGTLQYRVSDSSMLTLDGFSTDSNLHDKRGFLLFTGTNATAAGIVKSGSAVDANNVVTTAQYSNVGPVRVMMQDLIQHDVSNQFGVNYALDSDTWHVNADAAYSVTTRRQDQFQPTSQRVPGNVAATFVMTEPGVYSLTQAPDLGSVSSYILQNLNRQQLRQRDSLWQGRLDATHDLGGSFVRSVQAGINFVTRTKVANFDTDTQNFPLTGTKTVSLANYGIDFPYRDFLHEANGTFPQSFAVFDTLAVFQNATIPFVFDQAQVADLTASYNVNEDRLGAYAKLNYRLDGPIQVDGDIGLRYATTTVTSRGVASDVLSVVTDPATGNVTNVIFGNPRPVTLKNTFDDWLPNINVNIHFTDTLILRLGAAKTLTRAPIDSLRASRTLSFDTTAGQAVGAGGNPFLLPFRAKQYDASLEYYIGRDGLLAVAGFIKDLNTVIFPTSTQNATETFNGVTFQVSRPINVQNSRPIHGVEAQYQQTFSFLPGPLKFLGAVANYTYIDNPIGQQINPNFITGLEGVSKNIVNVAGYFDDGVFSARLAYRYRDGFFRYVAGNRIDSGGDFFDVNLTLKLTDNISLLAQGLNILDAPTIVRHLPTAAAATAPYDNLVNYTEYNGRRIFAGIRLKF